MTTDDELAPAFRTSPDAPRFVMLDWPAPLLWPDAKANHEQRWTAARIARLYAYALARIAGWRDLLRAPTASPVLLYIVLMPPRDWHGSPADAAIALEPALAGLADVLHVEPTQFRLRQIIDPASRLGLVQVRLFL